MTPLSDDDLSRLVRELTPLITSIIQETIRATESQRPQMTIQFGSLDSVDGPDAYIVMDDSEDGSAVQVTRAVATHGDGARVPVLIYPPSGALALPAVPDS